VQGSDECICSINYVYAHFAAIDQGCAQLIIEGKVKLKQGVELARVTTDTVKFTDGTELKADAIIFA
jgi:hypothetical protein